MRDLLFEQLQPVVSQSKKDRELTLIMKKRLEKQASKIKNLEQAVYYKKSRATVLEELEARLIEQEGNRKRDLIRLD
jgi:hypothetical protein